MASSSRLDFRIDAQASGSQARAATFHTLHGPVETPVFMPVGTQAAVRAQSPESLVAAGSRVLLANTYHLLLRPGPEVFRRMGGIHRFMSWAGPVLTDSGGYQIFSLPHSREVTEAGAVFQSYVDGKAVLLSPELSIATQVAIGSDIMMALDQCVSSTAGRGSARAALDLTHRWAVRSLEARGDSPQSLFGIVQGALFDDLRAESVELLSALPFDGLAIGGLAVGEGRDERQDVCERTALRMPRDKPRYLMGVGTPLDLLEAVHRGLDMFDCILPTALGKRGGVFTSRGYLQLRRGVHKLADEPLDPGCACPTCRRHSRAYLHHLTKTDEALGWYLLGQHNLHFYHRLMREIRQSILDDTFAALYAERRRQLEERDLDNPSFPPRTRPSRTPALGAYEVHVAREGFASIRHVASGEVMHARTPPLVEAERLYVDQSALARRLPLGPSVSAADAPPLVLWDVGLGAGANAMAAIRCYEQAAAAQPVRALEIVSFDADLDSLRLAFAHRHHFTYLRHGAPAAILASGSWRSNRGGLSWRLVEGDFFQTLARVAAGPDLVFYDLFSARTHAEAWTLSSFRRLFETFGARDAELFTYTASTAARVAMLGAGFLVATGRATDDKPESTIAFTPRALSHGEARRHVLLGAEWLERWKRSGARYPSDLPEAERCAFETVILGHPQFAPLTASPSRG